MLITQKIQIRKLSKQDYLLLKQTCKDSKNFYNSVLYEVRQHFFNNGEFLGMYARHALVKHLPITQRMKSDVAAHIQLRIDWAFRSFFELKKKQKSGDYHCKVRPPHYLPKNGYYHIYLSPKSFNFTDTHFYFHPSKQVCRENNLKVTYRINIPFKRQLIEGKIKQASIIQHNNAQHFELAITYEYDESKTNLNLNKDNLLSIDCGLDNFATCLDCQSGRSFILDGRELKSLNRWWNKEVAKLKAVYTKHKNSLKKKGVELPKSSKQLNRLGRWRKNQINNYLNQMVAYIIKYCTGYDIGTIVIGDWSEIKQNIKLGKRTNQNFIQIPFSNFKQKLKSKCEMYGLKLIFQDESYTSKCSFLDQEPVTKHEQYQGKRIKRGLFKTSKDIYINADVNGSANIAVKSNLRSQIYDLTRQSSGFTSNPKRIRLLDFERSRVKMSELVTFAANKQKQPSFEVTC